MWRDPFHLMSLFDDFLEATSKLEEMDEGKISNEMSNLATSPQIRA